MSLWNVAGAREGRREGSGIASGHLGLKKLSSVWHCPRGVPVSSLLSGPAWKYTGPFPGDPKARPLGTLVSRRTPRLR